MHIFLFGGTSEGRRIAETILQRNKTKIARCTAETSGTAERADGAYLCADVYVATDYGARLLPTGPGLTVHVGRLTAEEMQQQFTAAGKRPAVPEAGSRTDGGASSDAAESFLQADGMELPVLVIDATHPYAVLVSENIRKACAAARVHCLRVQRADEDSGSDAFEQRNGTAAAGKVPATGTAGQHIHWVPSIEAAAEWLRGWRPAAASSEKAGCPEAGAQPDGGAEAAAPFSNILITTGSKELRPYTGIPDYAARCYVRALPTMEALSVCRELGFRQDHLMLLQGPFSEEMNMAQLRHARAGVLVTKDSGETGGFPEKCEAAAAVGAELLVIGRPKEVSIPNAPWYHVANLEEVLCLLRADRRSMPWRIKI